MMSSLTTATGAAFSTARWMGSAASDLRAGDQGGHFSRVILQ